MVYKIMPEEDQFYIDTINALLLNNSSFVCGVDALIGAKIYKCGVNQNESHIAYWIKYQNECIAYFIVQPFALPNLCGFAAVRGWVAVSHRGIGLYPQLLMLAGNNQPLISDRDGTTEDAYNSWLGAKGFSHRYYDQHIMNFTSHDFVLEDQKFTDSPAGKRWLLVLDREEPA